MYSHIHDIVRIAISSQAVEILEKERAKSIFLSCYQDSEPLLVRNT